MKTRIVLCFLLGVALFSCKDQDRAKDTNPENDIDAARDFIRAALDGNYDKARTFLLPDSINQTDFNVSERLYNERMSPEDKMKYKGASIIIHQNRKINDSTTVVYYSNSYRNQQDSLRVVRMNGKWLVDFKDIFRQKPDSSK